MTPELKTPREWQTIKEVTIYDPDGWRRDNKNFDDPITSEEFDSRAIDSTVMVKIGSKWHERHFNSRVHN